MLVKHLKSVSEFQGSLPINICVVLGSIGSLPLGHTVVLHVIRTSPVVMAPRLLHVLAICKGLVLRGPAAVHDVLRRLSNVTDSLQIRQP
jgi:hypothetical protein